jgi:hypothetical protein
MTAPGFGPLGFGIEDEQHAPARPPGSVSVDVRDLRVVVQP